MSFLVYILFFGILGIIIRGSAEKRFMAFFAGTVLFPNVCLFIANPSISPQHIILYLFLVVEFTKNPDEFKNCLFKNPLRFPMIIVATSYIGTALINGGIASKDMYYGVRDIVDTYGYILAAFITGKKFFSEKFASQIFKFVCICCFFGILEVAFYENYPYKFINLAFPKYNGLYDLNSSISLSQDWRFRTCFTTKHPTAFGTLLMTLFLFYLPFLKKSNLVDTKLTKPQIVFILSLLGINIILCGSRTALVCTIIGALLYFIDKLSPVLKIFLWGILILSSSLIFAFMVAKFANSQGSSLDFRMKQLAFSVMTIAQSPILGNGNKYTSQKIFQEDDNGAMRAQDSHGDDMGGLESVVFSLLIDRGFVGLFSYYFLLLWLLAIFYSNRQKLGKQIDAFEILIAGTMFLSLSGSIGNSSAFLFIILGLYLGNIQQRKEAELNDDDAFLEIPENTDNSRKISHDEFAK